MFSLFNSFFFLSGNWTRDYRLDDEKNINLAPQGTFTEAIVYL